MDWHATADGQERLLTVSSDRNGYVWTRRQSSAEWQQTLVLLRLRRAATCVQWAADGSKFAVGGSEGIVSIGYYESENDWWVCKHLRTLDGSAVLATSWHPSGNILAVSTLAKRYHLITTCLSQKGSQRPQQQAYPRPSWLPTEELWCSFDQSVGVVEHTAWIHSLAFSPTGDALAMVSHDGQAHVVNLATSDHQVISHPISLPLRHVCFLDSGVVAVAGFDASPSVITRDTNGSWAWSGDLCELAAVSKSNSLSPRPLTVGGRAHSIPSGASSAASKMAFGGALAKFKSLDQQGITIKGNSPSVTTNTLRSPSLDLGRNEAGNTDKFHQGGISGLRLVGGDILSTSAYDGRLITWNMKTLVSRFKVGAL